MIKVRWKGILLFSIRKEAEMQGVYLFIGLLIVVTVILYFLLELRWRKRLEEIKADSLSQPMWTLMQQQMEQLRGQMGDGLNKNIALLTEQFRVINEQVNQQLQLVNQQLRIQAGRSASVWTAPGKSSAG